MAFNFPTRTASSQAPTDGPSPASSKSTPQPQTQHQRTSLRTAYPDEDGVGEQPPPRSADGLGDRLPRSADGLEDRLPYASTFGPLKAGRHAFVCCVESIVHWADGPSIGLRVRVGPDRGREIRWDQTPPRAAKEKPDGDFAAIWRRTIFGAYAAGGWTCEPNTETGWPGWPRARSGGYIPPYVDFFVVERDGVVVPVMLHVDVRVDAGYEARPKVVAIRLHKVSGELVQAPMPQKVTPWIAEHHRWTGTRKDISVKATDQRPAQVIPSVALKWDQVPLGLHGMKTLRDCV